MVSQIVYICNDLKPVISKIGNNAFPFDIIIFPDMDISFIRILRINKLPYKDAFPEIKLQDFPRRDYCFKFIRERVIRIRISN